MEGGVWKEEKRDLSFKKAQVTPWETPTLPLPALRAHCSVLDHGGRAGWWTPRLGSSALSYCVPSQGSGDSRV